LDVWKHNKSNKREKKGGNGKGKGDFAKFEINKGITLVLLINVWKIGKIASQQKIVSYFTKA
jgi:hypothetical protein